MRICTPFAAACLLCAGLAACLGLLKDKGTLKDKTQWACLTF
jgi:hypothetical protein